MSYESVFQAVSGKVVCFHFFNLPILTCILQGVYRKKGTRTSPCSGCTDTPGQLSALCLDDWLTSTSFFPSSVVCVCVCVCACLCARVCVCVLVSSPFTVWFPLHSNTIKPDTWNICNGCLLPIYLLAFPVTRKPFQSLLSFSWVWMASGTSPWYGVKDPYWLASASMLINN